VRKKEKERERKRQKEKERERKRKKEKERERKRERGDWASACRGTVVAVLSWSAAERQQFLETLFRRTYTPRRGGKTSIFVSCLFPDFVSNQVQKDFFR
jgi:hypothetical protein